MKLIKTASAELGILFSNEEVQQVAAITDYINRLYPELDEVLLEFTRAQAQEQAVFWRQLQERISDQSIAVEKPLTVEAFLLEQRAEGFVVSFKDAIYFGNSLQYVSFDTIPDEQSLSVGKARCRELTEAFYDAISKT